ncbi:MAG TPA: GDP-mannose 4,6-dehydratase, partial [Thermoanaerobaculia bacterium]|nr:GDP-mannose 4,6-dehydratase [Thermoanaerobaculia bacterium]
MNLLVTGGAGFIGSHLVDRRLARGDRVVVIDDFNDFYDPRIKRRNVAAHAESPLYRLVEFDIRDRGAIFRLFAEERFDAIVHLAARAG